VSNSMYRRRRWRTFATTVALALGSLAIPATALADGQIDPAFYGTGYHLGSLAEGTMFANVENRLPMVVQSDGRMVVGGSRGNAMTLVRYNTNGSIDTTFGGNGTGFASRQFSGTNAGSVGNSGAVAMTLDAAGNIIVAGYGGSASMVVARFTPAGIYNASTVCFAPLHIDYTARALALRPNGTFVVVGYARDRHPALVDPPTAPVFYGQRAVVTLPASGNSTTLCGGNPVENQGAPGVIIDGLAHDGTVLDPTLASRYYEGVAATATNYTVVSTTGPDGAAWIQRFAGTTLDPTFNGTGRLALPAVNLHAIKLAADNTAFAAGESIPAGADRQMIVAHVSATGVLTAGYGNGGSGIARIRVGGGNNIGQALVLQGSNVIVGGSANLAGRAAFGIARFTALGMPDASFGAGGQTATAIGVPAVNAYITGLAVNGNYVYASGRAFDAVNGLPVVAARYFHTGVAAPPPAPVAATNSVDQITTNSARVNGTVNANGFESSWWIEYGTTSAYGAQTATQSVAGTNDDIDVRAALTGLAVGTTYHARLVVTSVAGIDPGDDLTFTTLGIAVPGAGTTTPVTTAPVTASGGTTTTTTVKKTVKRKLQCVVSKVVGKKLNTARRTLLAKGCKVQLKYKVSKKAKNTILTQSRKAGKKLSYRAVVRLTVATTASALKA
jgi:uncharacterized delta-60 repeat protein